MGGEVQRLDHKKLLGLSFVLSGQLYSYILFRYVLKSVSSIEMV